MNERIREIAEQCQHRYSEHNIDLEKFAELIVKECIMVCWPGGESDVLYEQASEVDKAFIDGQDKCVEKLKNHFGVE
jgi:hypothetical protein